MTARGGLWKAVWELGAGFLTAVQFLTIVPVRRRATEAELGYSLAYFPVVGLGIGAVLYGLDRLFTLFLPVGVGTALLIVALVVLTGAHHLDGLIDTCDGMAAGRTTEQRLAIMRDTHAGSYGIVGVCCVLLLKYVSLLFLPVTFRMAALFLMPVAARWAMVHALLIHRPARSEGLGWTYRRKATWWALAAATVVTLGVSYWMMGVLGLGVMGAVWLIVLTSGFLLSRRLGGLTGDTYGAVNEVVEVSTLILVPLIGGAYF